MLRKSCGDEGHLALQQANRNGEPFAEVSDKCNGVLCCMNAKQLYIVARANYTYTRYRALTYPYPDFNVINI
jgi:hypothetical protein